MPLIPTSATARCWSKPPLPPGGWPVSMTCKTWSSCFPACLLHWLSTVSWQVTPKLRRSGYYLRRVSEGPEPWCAPAGPSDSRPLRRLPSRGWLSCRHPKTPSLLALLLEGLRSSLAIGCGRQSWSQGPLQSLLLTRQLASPGRGL